MKQQYNANAIPELRQLARRVLDTPGSQAVKEEAARFLRETKK